MRVLKNAQGNCFREHAAQNMIHIGYVEKWIVFRHSRSQGERHRLFRRPEACQISTTDRKDGGSDRGENRDSCLMNGPSDADSQGITRYPSQKWELTAVGTSLRRLISPAPAENLRDMYIVCDPRETRKKPT